MFFFFSLFNVVVAGVCGMESGTITDSQLSQSAYKTYIHTETIEFKHEYARLNNPDLCWSPNTGNFPYIWIQVDFLNPVTITGLLTQGSSPEYNTCVSGLYIETGNDESSLTKRTHDGTPEFGVIMLQYIYIFPIDLIINVALSSTCSIDLIENVALSSTYFIDLIENVALSSTCFIDLIENVALSSTCFIDLIENAAR